MSHVLPYVYKLTHKITQQYYFGFRCANTRPSIEDLGKIYFSSSKTIKEIGFNNFDFEIIAEFFDKRDAFNFESELIIQHINDPQCLNKAIKGNLCPIRKYTSAEHRRKLSEAAKGKKPSQKCLHAAAIAKLNMTDEERKQKFGKGGIAAQKTIAKMTAEERKQKFGVMRNKTHSADTIEKLRKSNLGKTMSDIAKAKMSKAGKGRKQSNDHIRKRTETFGGGGNPRAIPVIVDGILYGCKKDARIALGWSKNKLKAYLDSN